jgi:hypothetical protein
MRRLIFPVVLLFILLECDAQWSSRGTIAVSAGPSYPSGEFGYTQFDYDKSGFAKNGASLAISFNYRINAQLGLVASVAEYFLPVDEFNIAKKYWIQEYGYDWTVESTFWLLNAYMGGIDIILPVYKSDFQFRLLGGLASNRLPGLTGSAFNFLREATKDIAGAFSVGAGLTYQYFERITLSLGMDFFVTYPVLEEIWTSDLTSGTGTIRQNIVLVNLSAGLGFRLY